MLEKTLTNKELVQLVDHDQADIDIIGRLRIADSYIHVMITVGEYRYIQFSYTNAYVCILTMQIIGIVYIPHAASSIRLTKPKKSATITTSQVIIMFKHIMFMVLILSLHTLCSHLKKIWHYDCWTVSVSSGWPSGPVFYQCHVDATRAVPVAVRLLCQVTVTHGLPSGHRGSASSLSCHCSTSTSA
jgi:hypothetical protein